MKSIGTKEGIKERKSLNTAKLKALCNREPISTFQLRIGFCSDPTSKISLMCRPSWSRAPTGPAYCPVDGGGQTNIVRQGFTGFGNSVLFFSANIPFKIHFSRVFKRLNKPSYSRNKIHYCIKHQGSLLELLNSN